MVVTTERLSRRWSVHIAILFIHMHPAVAGIHWIGRWVVAFWFFSLCIVSLLG